MYHLTSQLKDLLKQQVICFLFFLVHTNNDDTVAKKKYITHNTKPFSNAPSNPYSVSGLNFYFTNPTRLDIGHSSMLYSAQSFSRHDQVSQIALQSSDPPSSSR